MVGVLCGSRTGGFRTAYHSTSHTIIRLGAVLPKSNGLGMGKE
jgi:hypothetical protein